MTKDKKISDSLVYHNDLNCFTFKNFKAVDYNLFLRFAIMQVRT